MALNETERLRAAVRYYEDKIGQMQSHVFFVQDEDGVLRRWEPPKLLSWRDNANGQA